MGTLLSIFLFFVAAVAPASTAAAAPNPGPAAAPTPGPEAAATPGPAAPSTPRPAAALLAATSENVVLSALSAQIPQGTEGSFTPHREAEKAISRLLSPFCPGLMLEVCPSPNAAALRDSIQILAADGMKADELVEWMLANHGEGYRAIPETRGAGLWAWVMPPLALLVGLALVILLLRRLRQGRAVAAGGRTSLSPEEREQVDAALRELEMTEGTS